MRLHRILDAIGLVGFLLAAVPEGMATGLLPGMSLMTLLTSSALAGPPFVTDDPEPVEYQHYEVYFFSQGTHTAREISGVAPSCDCNYGGFPNVQLHFQPGLGIDRSIGSPLQWGLGDTELGIKYRFIEQDKASWVPSIAIYPLLEVPTGDAARGLGTGRTHAFVPVWVQKDFGDWTTYGGGGYWINPGPGNKNYWFVGWVLERKITDRLMLGVELFHQTPNVAEVTEPAGFSSGTMLRQPSIELGVTQSTGFNIGAVYDFTDRFHLLVSAGRGLQHANSTNEFSWYLGLLWTGGE